MLDVILRMREMHTGIWERSIRRLRELTPPIDNGSNELALVLANIEKRLAQYIPLNSPEGVTRLYVSQLTREHLRKTMSFFLSTNSDQRPVPFQEVGTGTLNTLVLALLSFIAEVRRDNVIFAMEEPEIALPPHTQRRIANYLLTQTTQCLVTSHSPYVIERFDADQVLILRRDSSAGVTATAVTEGPLKKKTYRRYARRGLAEAMLGMGVVVVEGITEQDVIRAVAEKLETHDDACYPLDLSGVTILPVDGDGSLPTFGMFFKALGLKTYAFFDHKKRKPDEREKLAESFDLPNETSYVGMEDLLIEEVPVDRLWSFLKELSQVDEYGAVEVPHVRPDDEEVKTMLMKVLRHNKGSGCAARLIERCQKDELPASIVEFLRVVYYDFPRPESVAIPEQLADGEREPDIRIEEVHGIELRPQS